MVARDAEGSGLAMLSEEAENRAVQRPREGDAQALGLLMERYASRLYRVAFSITQNAADAKEVVRRAIDILPDQYRTVLVLRDIEELSNEKVAEIVGESLAAVKSRLNRAEWHFANSSRNISGGSRSTRPAGDGAACLIGRKWLGGVGQRQER